MSDTIPAAGLPPADLPRAGGGIPPAAEGPVRALAADLQAKFALPEGAIRVQRATRLWVDVDRGIFGQVFDFLVKGAGFSILCTITGLDLGGDLGLKCGRAQRPAACALCPP